MPIPPRRNFTCKWCGKKFPVYTNGQVRIPGPRVYGGDELIAHAEEAHPREVAALRRALGHDLPPSIPDGMTDLKDEEDEEL